MTTVGLLYPGHAAEDDFPRFEVLLDTDIRLPVVHIDSSGRTDPADPTGSADPAAAADPAGRTGPDADAERLATCLDELRMAGAESVVRSCGAEDGFRHGLQGAHDQVAALARAAGLPASSTSFGFAHALRELGATRVAVAAVCSDEAAGHFAGFLRESGAEVVATHTDVVGTAEAAAWDPDRVKELAVAGNHPDAEVVLLPDPALHTASYVPELEELLGKPVLTANQVTVWEGLRLARRRAWAPTVGTLFSARE
ncbi:decarboxylase [Streptomyces sp. AM 4-1-1]|uniref:maleate cis-trans isomerase family protein n=1 Tax=Streptomyces sp. AM 4-1-1 TaxID=3028710 RepID=UPI0023B8FC6B|nr:decarboxylase [Streptomyces sp. AM 4-1-1]WEH33548.1 decarboxylase [Streptomyces sp. AM 4-1-1]